MNAPASFQIRPAQVEFALPLPKQTRAMNSIPKLLGFTKEKIEEYQDVGAVLFSHTCPVGTMVGNAGTGHSFNSQRGTENESDTTTGVEQVHRQ